jgi:hypothetical protein
MDSFPRPDIAEGIFYEYLRLDNPMSFDFLDRAVEGFPFLLAPLSQVKGVASPVRTQHVPVQEAGHGSNPLFRTIGGFGEVLSTQAASVAENLHDIGGAALDKVRSFGDAAKTLGEEVERKRELIGKHVAAFTNQAMSSFYPKDQKSLAVPFPGWISDTELSRISGELYKQSNHRAKKDPLNNNFTRVMFRILGIEESSMSTSNATQKLFFSLIHTLVHLYLLLLLISSFPAQWTTRTKLIVTRKSTNQSSSSSHNVSDSDYSDSEDSGMSSVGVHDATVAAFPTPADGKEINIKKSLNYVL